MIGAFLINESADVCFAQYGAHERISGIRLAAGQTCLIVLEDGSEDMCTTELNEVIIKSLARKSDILIAHLDDDGELLTEYIVPLAIAA